MQDRSDDENAMQYRVVINTERQYSIWISDRPLPAGWSPTGFTGLKRECLEHIDEVWTDMRPLSLRHQMASDGVILTDKDKD